tara:strand:+ start:29158 stop:29994 length:837 start_codon:yes stop_codon:yes gene_type:complete
MQNQFKYVYLLFSAIITNILVLELLRIKVVSSTLSSFFLGSSYLLCSVFLLAKNVKILKNINKTYVYPALWGTVMGTIIVYFYENSGKLNVSDVLISQAISPTLGLLIVSGIPTSINIKNLILNNISFIFLVLIVCVKIETLNIGYSLFLLILMFTLAQIFLRITSSRLPSNYSYTISGFFIFIITSIRFIFNNEKLSFSLTYLLIIGVCSVGVFLIQKGYVEGVKNLPSGLSNLLISSGIPISIIYGYFFNNTSVYLLILSIGYILSVFYIKFFRRL